MEENAGSELAMASGKARVDLLVEDFKKCTPWRGGWNRLDWNMQVRDAVWEGMSADGKKHDTENAKAFPWDGASDARVFVADDICNYLVGLCVIGFFRSMIRFGAVEARDGEAAGDATRFMERMMEGPGFAELLAEVELSAQYFVESGVMVLHPTMVREIAYELRRVSLEEVAAAAGLTADAADGRGGAEPPEGGTTYGGAAGGGDPVAAKLLHLVMNPALEKEAVEFVQGIGEQVMEAEFAEFLAMFDCAAIEEWKVSEKRAREFVRGLREEGYGCIPAPVVARNEATVVALRPWDEVFFRSYAVDMATQARVYRREFLDEVGLRSRAAVEGWDEEWVRAAVAAKGKISEWSGNAFGTAIGDGEWSASGDWRGAEEHEDLIEVLYGYQKCVEEDGVVSYWLTVFSAHASDGGKSESPHVDSYEGSRFCAKHEQISGDEMCFVMGLFERRGRGVMRARGVPERVASRQREMKAHRDSLVDNASMSVLPPINMPPNAAGKVYKFGPAAVNVVQMGYEPKFMEVPTRGVPVAVEILDRVKAELAEEFGLGGKEVDPTVTAGKRQMVANNFLGPWTVALQGLWRLALANTSDGEYERITGGPKPSGVEARKGEDLILHFDVRDLDVEYVKEVYAAFKELTTIDAAGVIDKAKLVDWMARMINPSVAREVVVPGQGATQQLARKVKQDFLQMMAGMEPEYGEDDNPTAGLELRFAEELFASNPKMKQMMESDGDFRERMSKWLESKKFNVQQQENKVVGRIGVNPEMRNAE